VRRIGPYPIEDELGRGGMGVVYRSRMGDPPVPVAVKVLDKRADPRTRERFDREFRFMSAIRHPNVVSVHDAGEERGRPYIVMDLVPGGSLAQRASRLDLTAIVGCLAGAADGVQAVHDAGIIHRDVKPGNILLGAGGEGRISDFGIARTDAAGMTSTAGHLTATVAHVSPEVVNGTRPSFASDIYALGSTLYEVFAGRPAFVDGKSTVVQVLRRVLWEEPAPLPDVPAPVFACVGMAMAKDPAHRFATAAAFAAGLRAALAAAGLPGAS